MLVLITEALRGRVLRSVLVISGFLALFATGVALSDIVSETPVAPEAEPEPIAGSVDLDRLKEPHEGELTFAWPRDCVVPVSESLMGGYGRFSSDIEYELVLADDQGALVLTQRNVRVLRTGGRGIASWNSDRLAAGHRIPQFVINEEGAYIAPRRTEETLAEMATADPKFSDPADHDRHLGTLEARAADAWGIWVGRWVEWGAVGKQTLTATNDDGSSFTFSSLGTTRSRAAVLRYVEDLAEAGGDRRTTIEVVTDPTTLRPSSAHWEIESGSQDQPESTRTTQFNWLASDCAGSD